MGTRTLYAEVNTDKSLEEVKEATRASFRSLGGTIEDTPTGIMVKQGKNGVSFGFSADFTASVNLRQVKEGKYEIECLIKWSLNALGWVCLIVGLFVLGVLWIVPILYLFVKPDEAYQQALNRVKITLE